MIKYLKTIGLSLTIVLTLSACFDISNLSTSSNSNNRINFKDIGYELINPLCENISKNSTIYITDFVNESNLKNKSQLGFLLSNQSKVNILDESCTKNVKIQDLQLGKQLKISKNGSRILTREINDLKISNINEDKQIIAGSYIITQNQIIYFAKLLNLKTGDIISTSSTSKPMSDEYRLLEGIRSNEERKNSENENQIRRPFHL